MIKKLGLKGNELIVYALIYGFCQDGGHFTGDREYVSHWLGIERLATVTSIIQRLMKKGLVEKTAEGIKIVPVGGLEERTESVQSTESVPTESVRQECGKRTEKVRKPHGKSTESVPNNINNINNIYNNIKAKKSKASEPSYDTEKFTNLGIDVNNFDVLDD